MKSDYTTNSRYITHTIAFWKVGRIHFLSSGVKGKCGMPRAHIFACVSLAFSISFLGYFRTSKTNSTTQIRIGSWINRALWLHRDSNASRREGASHIPTVMQMEHCIPVPLDSFRETLCLKNCSAWGPSRSNAARIMVFIFQESFQHIVI